MLIRSLLVTCALALTTACGTPPSAPVAAGPGPTPLAEAQAGELFGQVCYGTLPRFDQAASVLAELGFIGPNANGTYYDGQRDLSFQINGVNTQGECSFVFGVPGNGTVDQAAFRDGLRRAGVPNADTIPIGTQNFAGVTYVNVRLAAQ